MRGCRGQRRRLIFDDRLGDRDVDFIGEDVVLGLGQEAGEEGGQVDGEEGVDDGDERLISSVKERHAAICRRSYMAGYLSHPCQPDSIRQEKKSHTHRRKT